MTISEQEEKMKMKMAKFSFLKRKEQLAIFLFFSLSGLVCLWWKVCFFGVRGEREKEREREMANHQLFEAVGGGDCEKVKQLLLSRRVDVNQAPRHQVIIFFSSFFIIIILSGDDSVCVELWYWSESFEKRKGLLLWWEHAKKET